MGALTSKPYAFTARPWELLERESVNIFDPFGSSVKLSLRGGEVMRVLPNVRFTSGDEWLSDSSRFSYDSILSESRLKFITMVFQPGSDNFVQICFSNIWFNGFLTFRLGYLVMPDHFSLAYVNTSQFFQNFSGFAKNSTVGTGFFDNRFFPAHQLDSLYLALNAGFKNLFFFDLNIRYLFPTVSVKLRQIFSSGRGPSNVFNVGSTTNNLLSETNLACSPKMLALTLRCKNRISRLIFSSNSYTIFDFTTFVFFRKYVTSAINYSVFHKNSASVSHAEFGFSALQSRSLSPSYSLESGFLSAVYSTNFAKAKAICHDVILPLPHPYEDRYDYYVGGKAFSFQAVISQKIQHFPLSFKLAYYNEFRPSKTSPLFFNFYISSKFYTNFSNHITHFLFSQFQVNSINILLNVKRHNEFRSNYIYYLRPC